MKGRIKPPARCKPVRRAHKRWSRRNRKHGGWDVPLDIWLTYTHASNITPELFRYARLCLKAAER